jgi:hypothetical protein
MSVLKVNNIQNIATDGIIVDGVVQPAALPSGSILQVVSTTKTDSFTMSSSTFADITSFSVSITPSSATSKIFISGVISAANQVGTNTIYFQLVRDSTVISVGDSAGTRSRATFEILRPNEFAAGVSAFNFLDSPSSTSAITYKIQVRTNGSGTAFINRSQEDGDQAVRARSVSTITVMEVAG